MCNLKTYTVEDIRALGPCYDPVTGLDKFGAIRRTSRGLLFEGWTGSLLDILNVVYCPQADRLWVVFGLLPAKEQRLLACQLVRYTPWADGRMFWDLLTDERSRTAVEVSERYARGEASEDELDNARSAARDVSETPGTFGGNAFSCASWSAARGDDWGAGDLANAVALTTAKRVIGVEAWHAVVLAARTAQIEIVRSFLLQEDSHA